jgi:hypothetical protein
MITRRRGFGKPSFETQTPSSRETPSGWCLVFDVWCFDLVNVWTNHPGADNSLPNDNREYIRRVMVRAFGLPLPGALASAGPGAIAGH